MFFYFDNKQIYKNLLKCVLYVLCEWNVFLIFVDMEKFRKEIQLPLELKKQLKIQAIEEGFNSMKHMIEQKTIKSLKEYKQDKE